MITEPGVIYEPRYRNLAVKAGPEHGLRTVILDRLYERYGYMIEHKSAFLIAQLRIMPMPGNGCFGDNSAFREFCATFPEYLMQQGIESHHVWVRRHPGFASGHRYILAMLLDAGRSDCFRQHLHKADELWSRALGKVWLQGLISFDQANDAVWHGAPVLVVRKDSPGFHRDCRDSFQSLSHIAHMNPTDRTPGYNREYGCSPL